MFAFLLVVSIFFPSSSVFVSSFFPGYDPSETWTLSGFPPFRFPPLSALPIFRTQRNDALFSRLPLAVADSLRRPTSPFFFLSSFTCSR